MSERDPQPPSNFDDLEPMPAEAELADLPDGAMLEELPESSDLVELEELPELVELQELDELKELTVDTNLTSKPKPRAKSVAKAAPAKVTPKAPEPAAKASEATAPSAPPVPAQPVAVAATAAATAATADAKGTAKSDAKSDEGAADETDQASADGVRSSSRSSREKPAPRPKAKAWERWAGPGEKPKREMEAAPALLRKAALGLLIGCLLPWGGVTPDWTGNIVEKLLVLAGLFVWHETNSLRDGLPVKGFITKLGATRFLPLFVMAGVLTLLGFAPLLSSESLFADFKSNGGPIAEKGFMILAGLTLTHIQSYERGGKFSPMLPIMFLAPAIAGIMAVLKAFSGASVGIGEILGGLGAFAVSGAGWMAAYTMYTAIQEARVHGEAKKVAQAEARKAARKARK